MATRRQGRIRGAGDKTLRDASSRATKAFYPALSMCDLIFSGVFGYSVIIATGEAEAGGAPESARCCPWSHAVPRLREGRPLNRLTVPA